MAPALQPQGRHVTKEEYVARYLREGIVAGRWEPGERLRQQQLADELGMSPTPVREAVRSLVKEGWLELRPHIGASVAEIDYGKAEEVYMLREMIEGRLAREAAERITNSQLKALAEVHEAFKASAAANDHGAARERNFQFHALIWEASGWPVAIGILEELWAQAPWATMGNFTGREARTYDEHARVLEALEAHDPEGSREALEAHIRSGRNDYKRTIADKVTPAAPTAA
jgi:DNA-binding GntR family transcriptional regulator